MSSDAVLGEVDAIGRLLDEAADALMSVAERGIALAESKPLDGPALSAAFAEVLQLCAFQDLAGQRLQRLATAVSGAPADPRSDAALLNGPANEDGLDQDRADALFNAS